MSTAKEVKIRQALITKLLPKCVSTDTHRKSLAGACHLSELEALTACNGHTAVMLKSRYNEKLKDLIIDIKTLEVSNLEYPKMSGVVPDWTKLSNAVTTIRVEHAIAVKRGQKPIVAHFYMKKDFTTGDKIVTIEVGGDSPTARADKKIELGEPDYLFSMNSAFLKPLIGNTFRFAWNNTNRLAPVLFSLSLDEQFTDTYLTMPLKHG